MKGAKNGQCVFLMYYICGVNHEFSWFYLLLYVKLINHQSWQK